MKTILSSFIISLAVASALLAGNPNPPSAQLLITPTQPIAGTNCVQTLTFGGTPTGGTFIVRWNNRVSTPITWNSTNATLVSNIDTALKAMGNIGASGVVTAVGTMTAGIGTITVTFQGINAKLLIPVATVYNNSMTGSSPTLAIAITTPGVTADGRAKPQGTLCLAADTGILYEQRSTTALNPSWVQIATP